MDEESILLKHQVGRQRDLYETKNKCSWRSKGKDDYHWDHGGGVRLSESGLINLSANAETTISSSPAPG